MDAAAHASSQFILIDPAGTGRDTSRVANNDLNTMKHSQFEAVETQERRAAVLTSHINDVNGSQRSGRAETRITNETVSWKINCQKIGVEAVGLDGKMEESVRTESQQVIEQALIEEKQQRMRITKNRTQEYEHAAAQDGGACSANGAIELKFQERNEEHSMRAQSELE